MPGALHSKSSVDSALSPASPDVLTLGVSASEWPPHWRSCQALRQVGSAKRFLRFFHVDGWEWWIEQDEASWVGTCLFTKVCCKLAGQLYISLSLRPIAQLCPGRIHGKVLHSHLCGALAQVPGARHQSGVTCSALSPALLTGPGWFQVCAVTLKPEQCVRACACRPSSGDASVRLQGNPSSLPKGGLVFLPTISVEKIQLICILHNSYYCQNFVHFC